MTPAIVIASFVIAAIIVMTIARECALLTDDMTDPSALPQREARRPKKNSGIPAGTLLKGAVAGLAAAAISVPVGMALGIGAILLLLAWLA